MGYKGTSLDLKNDLNYGQMITPIARVKAELPLFLPNLYFIANPMRFDSTGIRTSSFKFGDVANFSANVPFSTTLKLDHYDVALFYGVPFLKTVTDNILNVEFGLNLRIIDFKAEITQSQTGLSQSKSLIVPVPMGYAGIQIAPVELIKIEAELRGIAYGTQRYYDALGRVKIKPIPFLFIAGGYKFENIHLDQSDVLADLRFGGPVIEAGIEF